MITVPYCGYRFRNPDRDAIYRPSGTDSFLFLMILSPMTFYFEDREPEHAEAGACIFYPPFVFHHYQAEGEFLNSFVHFRCDPPLPEPYPILTGRLFYPEQPEEIHSLLRLIQQEHLNRQDNYAQMEDLLVRQLPPTRPESGATTGSCRLYGKRCWKPVKSPGPWNRCAGGPTSAKASFTAIMSSISAVRLWKS